MLIFASRYVLSFLALLGVLRPHALAYFLIAASKSVTILLLIVAHDGIYLRQITY